MMSRVSSVISIIELFMISGIDRWATEADFAMATPRSRSKPRI